MPPRKKKADEVPAEEMTGEEILAHTIAAMEKQLGKGIIMTKRSDFPGIERITTGSISLDEAIGGGYPRGRIIEIYGPESSGKTTLALHAIAEAQKLGHRCAFVDAEHALDVNYAEALGVNLDEILISQPDSAEQALDAVEFLVRSKQVQLIVVDSVAALTPMAELEGTMGDSIMGKHALLMSKAMRKLNGKTFENDVIIIFINQIRMKIGCVAPETMVKWRKKD